MIDKKNNPIAKTNLLSKFVFAIGLFLFWCSFAQAKVSVSEIMYDVEGTDTGREWVEFFNDGDGVDITGWRFYENDTNHKITGENFSIPANSYFIVANNVDKFSEDNPSFSGLLFDSAFSLSNSGETFGIKDSELGEVDTVTYDSGLGANGDGNSLQLVNGKWISGIPTLGTSNVSVSQNSADENLGDDDNDAPVVSQNTPLIKQKIFAEAGENRNLIVGADSIFKGETYGLQGEPINNARYIWSFGDGGSKEGQNILYAYKYPGKYVVILNVASGEYSANDRILVNVLPADIVVSVADTEAGFIEIDNRSDYELNLSWWRIRSGNQYFSLPKDTIILPKSKIRLSVGTIGFVNFDLNQTYLLYPNGEIANKYEYGVVVPKTKEVSTVAVVQPQPQSQPIVTQKQNSDLDVNINNEKIDESVNNETAIALVEKSGFDNKWFLILLCIVFSSVVGVLFVRGLADEDQVNDEIDADDFEIID